ncbi:MAG: ABC transporter permease subunit [Rhodobacteraceae bacterium]|nr:ABC transporter permease subunit [Paracoccaceae bacterium]
MPDSIKSLGGALRRATRERLTFNGRNHSVLILSLGGLALSLLVRALTPDGYEFPETLAKRFDLAGAVNEAENWLQENISFITRAVSEFMGYWLEKLELFLWFAPWPAVALALTLPALAYGGLGLGLFTFAGVMCWGLFGMWDAAMSTLSLMGVSVIFSAILGILVGILCARSNRTEAIVRPILDTMQTMPAFVYLIPAIFFFGIGGPSAAVAIVIYAIPPVIRLTNLGIRQVPATMIEAADAFGSTPRQRLWKVEIPQALPSIMLGINQTIMMALGLCVLATFIGAGGLGEEVWKALRRLKVGWALEGGLCIVFMAIIFDRLSIAMSTPADRRSLYDPSRLRFRLLPQKWDSFAPARWIESVIDVLWRKAVMISGAVAGLSAAAAIAAKPLIGEEFAALLSARMRSRHGLLTGGVLIILIFLWDSWISGIGTFPRDWTISIREPADGAVAWLAVNPTFIAFTTGTRAFIYLYILNPLDNFFVGLPWWYVLAAFFVLILVSVNWKFAVISVLAFLFTGITDLWGVTMYTLASTIASVSVCVVIGLPIGIIAAHNRTLDNFIRPILDAMQTMPAFVYLVPVLMFFGGNPVTAIIATVVYAIPPMIRMTILGLRQVPENVTEVSGSFGATGLQTLIKLKLPMASPSIMLGVNQSVVMALAMQVITPLVAGLGLGKEVFDAMNFADTGQGLMAGIGIVLLAIVLDRLTQGWTRRQRQALGL